MQENFSCMNHSVLLPEIHFSIRMKMARPQIGRLPNSFANERGRCFLVPIQPGELVLLHTRRMTRNVRIFRCHGG